MKTIITIGRQFGSGGKEIGIRVAKELGIPFYDKELLQEAAKKSGLCEKIFENFDERPKSLLYSIAMDSYMFALPGSGVGDSLEQQVYLATFNTIRHIADQGPCVIIGRCADYALADYPNHLSLFISAPLEVRIQRVAQRQNLTPEKARQLILKTDKRRASYFYSYEDFLEIMRLLRAPGGCPWDREQTHSSIRRNFLEETYEVLDAIDHDDASGMCEELGDVLMQVAFHAQIEAERGRFTMANVVDGVARKLVYRHPHVFGDVQADTSQQVLANWDVLKRREKGQRSTADAVEAVPHTLPALWRAEKIQSKTAKAGFDWTSSLQALDKLEEEVRELRAALEAGQAADAPHGIREELGDTLFMAAKIAQMSGVDPEDALHRACDKFDRRFRAVEEAADKPLPECGEAELLALWNDAKSHDPS